jgi:hypothetical protein
MQIFFLALSDKSDFSMNAPVYKSDVSSWLADFLKQVFSIAVINRGAVRWGDDILINELNFKLYLDTLSLDYSKRGTPLG